MKFKDGVKAQGMNPEILLALIIVEGIYKDFHQELVITAITDGKHKEGSKHYDGDAVDTRTRYFNASEKELVYKDIKDALSDEYDVIWHTTHFHIEFDPKD